MSMMPRARLRLLCDDGGDGGDGGRECPKPSLLRELLVACAPIALTAVLQMVVDDRRAATKTDDSEG